jgi:H+-translocating NAD(P) transhydrogenase subunit alpha
MKIAIPTETQLGEARVAASPDTVKAYLRKGTQVAVQSGAGLGSNFSDEDYKAAGASIVKGEAVVKGADIVLTIRRPSDKLMKAMKPGAIIVGGLEPHGDRKALEAFAKSGVTAFALELMPRITRAQSMDILSSQANLAGYKAVVDAAANFNRAFPMMMTAAGTVAAAKVFIMGVGVAGLQAIATARRLGAIVTATDVRKATEEQVKSLGAKFIYVDLAEAATAAGYARELTAEEKAKQSALVAGHVKSQDIVITTALIPGRPAPILITKDMVESMKPGSIIVDLAVERGGNCPLSKPDQIVDHKGVKIIGAMNPAGKLAGNAAPLFAKNIANFLDLMIQKDGTLKIDEADECVSGTMIAKGGKLVHKIYGDAK